MRLVIITKQASYILSLVRMNAKKCSNHINSQKEYLIDLRKEDLITEEQMKNIIKALDKAEVHCIHSMLHVSKEDLISKQIQKYLFAITSSPNKVTILKSLSESVLGENPEYYNVIKILDDLYITSHSLAIHLSNELPFEELQYDKNKGHYVGFDKSNNLKDFKNFTNENIEKMCLEVISRLEYTETKIEKIDITTTLDLKNDIVAFKYLEEFKKGTFDKATYQEIDSEMDQLDEKFTKIENEFTKYLEGTKKSDEEL
jgi:hypothetical protein